MSRFSGRQHPGAQAAAKEERRADAEKRNAAIPDERRKANRLGTATVEVVPTKRKRGKK